jgi:hypothetical protein
VEVDDAEEPDLTDLAIGDRGVPWQDRWEAGHAMAAAFPCHFT